MNEFEMTELLERAAGTLRPDVGRLVEAGVRGGRRRRRRTTGALVAATAVVCLGAGAGAFAGQGSNEAVPDRSAPAAARPGGVSTGASLDLVRGGVAHRLARLLPGATTLRDGPPGRATDRGSVDWRGLHVTVEVTYGHPEGRATVGPGAGVHSVSGRQRLVYTHRSGDRRVVLVLGEDRRARGVLLSALNGLADDNRWDSIVRSPVWRH